ncbi:MAG: hypothetical protein WDO15_11325 [Bacteroidota bacterium]
MKKFLYKTYGLRSPIKVEENELVGKLVTLCLRDRYEKTNPNNQYRDRLTDNITIVLTKRQSEFGPQLHKLFDLNTHLDKEFKDHMITWIRAHQAAGIPAYNACRMYLEHLSIDENEYAHRSAYKYWGRYNAPKEKSMI